MQTGIDRSVVKARHQTGCGIGWSYCQVFDWWLRRLRFVAPAV